MSNDTSNTILKAIETMVKNEVNQLQADITEKGIIKKIANKSERKYEATYQGVSIYLYAKEGEQYNQGDEVYFVVPKGDLSNKKIIQGLVNAEPAAPFYTNGPTWDIIYRPKDENEKFWSGKTYGLKMGKDEDSIPIYDAVRDKAELEDQGADGELEIWGIGAKTFSIQASFWTKLYDIPDLDIEGELEGEFGIRVTLISNENIELIYELKPQTLLDQILLTGEKKTLTQTFELPSQQGAFKQLKSIDFYQSGMEFDPDSRAINTNSWNLLVSDIKIGYDSLETDELFQATLRKETKEGDHKGDLVVDLLDRSTSKSFFENIDYCNENVRVHFYKEHLNAKSSILLGRGWDLRQRTNFGEEEKSGGRNIEKRKYCKLPDPDSPKDYENYKAVVVVHLTKEMKKTIASNAGISTSDLKDALTFVTNNYVNLNEEVIDKTQIGQIELVIDTDNKKRLFLKIYNKNLEEISQRNYMIYSVFSENDQIIKTLSNTNVASIPLTDLNKNYKNYTVRIQYTGNSKISNSNMNLENFSSQGFWEWNSRTGSKMMQVDKTVIEEG